ncbi:hypothetical protein C0J52_20225 [Blattella germanica]|nr:hypothetical protein C0J52_20225 [Blattella germanica]
MDEFLLVYPQLQQISRQTLCEGFTDHGLLHIAYILWTTVCFTLFIYGLLIDLTDLVNKSTICGIGELLICMTTCRD